MDVHMHLENKKVSFKFFWILWFMYAMVYMTKNFYSAAMASIVSEGILTKSQMGLINAMFYGVYGSLQILGGIFSDKYNPEKLIKIGLVGAGISNVIIFFCQEYYVMLAAWTFNAVIQFALYPAVFKMISSQLEAEYRLKGVYYLSMSSVAGMVCAYLVAAFVSKWQYNFALSAIVLFALTIIFHFACKWVSKYMVADECPQTREKITKGTKDKVSTWAVFLGSGFFYLIIVTMLRTIVANGVQTLSSTMLMETYANISPKTGNILNILIIVSGVIGTTLVNQFVHPRLTRNEVKATLGLIVVTVLPVIAMCFVGSVSPIVIVICLCVISAILQGVGLLMSRCCAAFMKCGKNGVASGVNNAMASIAIMIQSYGVVLVAEHTGWKMVGQTFVILLVVSIVILLVALPLWKRFRAK